MQDESRENDGIEPVWFISAPYKAGEEEVFVDKEVDIGNGTTDRVWVRKKKCKLENGERPIPCIICGEPATRLDHHYPYEAHGNRCDRHRNSRIDEEAYTTLGVGIEVCKEHYMVLQMISQMMYCHKWLQEAFPRMPPSAARLCAVLEEGAKAANVFRVERWPDEQLMPMREE